MTFVAAVVCPHPPLLVPEVGGAEPVAVRPVALDAVRRLAAAGPDRIVVVGDVGDVAAAIDFGPTATGTYAGYGVPLTVGLAAHPGSSPTAVLPAGGESVADPAGWSGDGGEPSLPLSLTTGAWLLAATGWPGVRTALGVPAGYSPDQAAELGARLAAGSASDERLGLLVMGDGSARRTLKAPGGLDERAEPFDATVATALADVDPAGLLDLDPVLARDLLAAGRASWQVLAGALVATAGATAAITATRDDTPRAAWTGELVYDEAPYGVGYLVAVWIRGNAEREGMRE
ncbi:class III extradiol dioxygenase subunit B-like domain-containing protein [Frankia sp. R82]|uniref:class III extradiol dioxygenase subunit B-like domain-containing protein n=1 Tax=Frankia sp. R82 TaxID=2950553 RepID=UPI00204316CA|nr:class III extradiol dioxygenase subunit B-like domain-containing protein [Frankia sp. R82]MCM3885366.1 class III extradiol dioxygenase subunit B-like domain-containing protein [Frankia sp. R82]